MHLNHPNVPRYFKHLRADAKPGEGFPHLEGLIDAAELWGENILSGAPVYEREYQGKTYKRQNWPFYWMQMLNTGTTIWSIRRRTPRWGRSRRATRTW